MCHVSHDHVMCHMSYVTCHVSHVMCHMSHVICHMSHVLILYFFLRQSGEGQGGGSVTLRPGLIFWGLDSQNSLGPREAPG